MKDTATVALYFNGSVVNFVCVTFSVFYDVSDENEISINGVNGQSKGKASGT